MTATCDILERLIGFDTVSARTNLPLVDHVQAFLADRGFRVTQLADPAGDKAGLYAEIGPSGAGGVLLSAHSDVVPVEGQEWRHEPFRLHREGTRLYGRGTTDMKGFVAAMMNMADAAARVPLREPLKLLLSYDEEIGCVGIARMMDRLTPLLGQPRMAIVGEPTEMQVATGHKGKRAYHARISGQAGHSALAPRFVNALNVAADFMQALKTLQQELERTGPQDPAYDVPYSTVHVGMLSGGRAVNIVPDLAEMTFEVRHLPGDDPDDLDRRIEAAAARVCAPYGSGAQISLEQLAGYPGLATPDDAAVVRRMQALAGTGQTKVAFGTEAGFFDAIGIPTVVCGPGSMAAQGHKADEYIETDQLDRCDAVLARLLDQMRPR